MPTAGRSMYFPAGSTRSSNRRFLKPRHNGMATLINAALILLAVTREFDLTFAAANPIGLNHKSDTGQPFLG